MQPMQQNYNMQQNHYQGGGDGGMMGGGMEAMHQGQMGGGQMGGGQIGGGPMGGQMGGGPMGGGGQVAGAPPQSMASAAQPPTGEQNFDYMFKLLIIGWFFGFSFLDIFLNILRFKQDSMAKFNFHRQ